MRKDHAVQADDRVSLTFEPAVLETFVTQERFPGNRYVKKGVQYVQYTHASILY